MKLLKRRQGPVDKKERGFTSPRGARLKPGIEEMELWPDLSWRLSALLRAGLSPARAFGVLNAELEATPSKGWQGWWEKIHRESSIERARRWAEDDIGLILRHCAHESEQGKPVYQALESLALTRIYSQEKTQELAACWKIGEKTGAPLTQVLERLARYLEQEIDLSQARDSAMSGPKSTGVILSWLPLLGLGLGILMGTNPLGVLLGSIPGAIAAFLGIFLALLGRVWTARLVERAEQGLERP